MVSKHVTSDKEPERVNYGSILQRRKMGKGKLMRQCGSHSKSSAQEVGVFIIPPIQT